MYAMPNPLLRWETWKAFVLVFLAALLGLLIAGLLFARPMPPAPDAINLPEMIVSPASGSFWAGEVPGAPPAISVGDHVEPQTIVGSIDVERKSEPILARQSGTIVSQLVVEGESVQAGQPLYRLQLDRSSPR